MNNIEEYTKNNALAISPDEIVKDIVVKDDFAIINGKIEPTRNLALKLFAATKIESYTVEIQNVVTSERETVYCCKATVERAGKRADGLGACSTAEVDKRGGQARHHHDALATAETRAYKRAIEAVVGLPFINEIIVKLFGGYDVSKPAEEQAITAEKLIEKIREARAMPHLANIWSKYRGNLKTYTQDEAWAVITAKNTKKEELNNEYVSRHNDAAYQTK